MKAKTFLLGLLTITLLLVSCVPLETPPEDNSQNSSYPPQIDSEEVPETTQIGDLTMEVYQLKIWKPGMEEGKFDTTIGSSEEILNSGIILSAMGFPTAMFTPIFALSRTVGWISQWKEMLVDPDSKIGRPRQLYIGSDRRDYLDVAKR